MTSNKNQKILVTGGAGYIGTHTLIELDNSNYETVVIDNFSNSKKKSIDRVKKILNKEITIYQVDLLNKDSLDSLFRDNNFSAVIHFAGLKSVNESVMKPISYFLNNVSGTINLLEIMDKYNVRNLIFSSSASIYDDSFKPPYNERNKLKSKSPYGETKIIVEKICQNLANSAKKNNEWRIVCLRYFNPIGAHKSGLIGEDPFGNPNNIMPIITQTAIGKKDKIYIYGSDYNTSDGTGVRDYIHVNDLARGHIASLKYLLNNQINSFCIPLNLGMGEGFSVLELINKFVSISKVKIDYEFIGRREGDTDASFADNSLAKEILGWNTNETIETMIEDSWRWQRKNPNGFE